MLEHVLVLERSDRVPYIRLPYGDPGFESVSLHRRVSELSVPLETKRVVMKFVVITLVRVPQ
jgi:hypothetical protein